LNRQLGEESLPARTGGTGYSAVRSEMVDMRGGFTAASRMVYVREKLYSTLFPGELKKVPSQEAFKGTAIFETAETGVALRF